MDLKSLISGGNSSINKAGGQSHMGSYMGKSATTIKKQELKDAIFSGIDKELKENLIADGGGTEVDSIPKLEEFI